MQNLSQAIILVAGTKHLSEEMIQALMVGGQSKLTEEMTQVPKVGGPNKLTELETQAPKVGGPNKLSEIEIQVLTTTQTCRKDSSHLRIKELGMTTMQMKTLIQEKWVMAKKRIMETGQSNMIFQKIPRLETHIPL